MPMQYITQSVFAVLCSPFLTPTPRDTKGWSRRASPNGKLYLGTTAQQAVWLAVLQTVQVQSDIIKRGLCKNTIHVVLLCSGT